MTVLPESYCGLIWLCEPGDGSFGTDKKMLRSAIERFGAIAGNDDLIGLDDQAQLQVMGMVFDQ